MVFAILALLLLVAVFGFVFLAKLLAVVILVVCVLAGGSLLYALTR